MSFRRVQLLPGLHGTSALFGPLKACAERWASDTIEYPATATESSDILETLESSVSRNAAVLVAESFSGPFAVRFARLYPARVAALVLVNSFLRPPYRRLLKWTPHALVPPPAQLISRFLLNKDADPEVVQQVRQTLQDLPTSLVAARLRLLARFDAREDAAQLRMPVLVIQSSGDRLVRRRQLREMNRRIPDASVREVRGPHLLLQARPRESYQLIESWLAESADPSRVVC